MSIRQNSNRKPNPILSWIVTGFIFFFVLMNILNKPHRPIAGPSQMPPETAVVQPAGNPIMDMLAESAGQTPALRDGIAIGMAIDVSGSMKDSVRNTSGLLKPKIEIARQCALDILKQADSFAQQHPDKTIEVGVFEFSSRQNRPSCRQVIAFGPMPKIGSFEAVNMMFPSGGTPIGDAIITVKQKMNATGLSRQHLLVITDGENNQGYAPGDVVNAISRMPDEKRASVYFFAFDVAAEKFSSVREAGGLVMAAANEQELKQTLDYVMTGKILAEQPEVDGTK